MANIQRINIGSYANDGSGDDLRTAFNKVNANFALLTSDGNEIPVKEAANLNTGSYTSVGVSKAGSGPYNVTFSLTGITVAPTINVLYYVTGNTNTLYNGQFMCTGSSLGTITLSYPTDPGIFSATVPTTISRALGIFKDKNDTTLEFNSIQSTNGSIAITPNSTNNINLPANVGIQLDTIQKKPALQGDLLLNNFVIRGGNGTGDIDATVNGIRVDVLNAVLGLILQGNLYNIDLGTIVGNYSVVNLDLGTLGTPINNSLDFGHF
jgi:hypothetical protein